MKILSLPSVKQYLQRLMETFCTVILNLWVWGVKFKHSNCGQNFSSKMRSQVTDPGSQRMCRWEKFGQHNKVFGQPHLSLPNHWFWKGFLSGRMGQFKRPVQYSHPGRWCNHGLNGSNLGFWVRWEQCFLLLGKGYFQVSSQLCSFSYKRNVTLLGNCKSIRKYGRLKTPIKLETKSL